MVKKSASKKNLSELGEFGLIDRIQSLVGNASPRVVKGIGDDCAVYRVAKDRYQVITTDALVEDVHFSLKHHPPKLLGKKTLSVSLSDQAAMGATPQIAVIALGIPKNLPIPFLDRFYAGLNTQCNDYGVSLVGGDTVKSTKGFWVTLTLVGEAKKNRLFTRSGARSGDAIMVTGTLGDSALGLKLLLNKGKKLRTSPANRKYLIQRHLDPTPRVEFAKSLAASKIRVTSMIDISDGLTQDLQHIVQNSGTGATLNANQIPTSRELKNILKNNKLESKSYCFDGGEDYELLFTSPVEDVKKIEKLAVKVGVPVTEIGKMNNSRGQIQIENQSGSAQTIQDVSGFDHFSRGK